MDPIEIRKSLTHEQKIFVDTYLETGDKFYAYQKSGLAEGNTSDNIKADRLLRRPRIRAYIDGIERATVERQIISIEKADEILSDVATTNLVDVLEVWNGDPATLKSLLPKSKHAGLKKIKIKTTKIDGETCEIVEIAVEDKLKALEMLIRRNNGYESDMNKEAQVQVIINPGNNNRG